MSMIILFFILHVLLTETTCYVLISSDLTWNGSSNICKWKCNSELASIHNEQQQQQILNLINNDNINQLTQKSYWIGLYKDNITKQWVWSDNSATYILNTSYDAWYPSEPNNDYENCVELHAHNGFNYAWNDARCDKNIRTICNQCTPILELNKYILIYGEWTHSEANNECYQQYGTHLSSIHNDRDELEASNLCKSSSDGNCWLGASDEDMEGIWLWNDGTEWNYTDWAIDRPNDVNGNEHCLQIWSMTTNEDPWKWDDYQCGQPRFRAICAMPSLLCLYNKWNVIGGNWTWITSASMCGEVINSNRADGNILWYGDESGNVLPLNVWDDIIIEYTYTMTDTVSYGDKDNAGIIFGAQTVTDHKNDGDYYNVEIRPATNRVVFSRTRNNDWSSLRGAKLNFIYESGVYYRLKVEVVENNFNVYVNDELYINYTDNSNESFAFGTIGLRNYFATTISKYLYVSEYTYIIPTVNPTTDPTVYPSVNPTIYPTNMPTLYPTNMPTSNPTNIPTIYPTNIPTITPTAYPTIYTLNPTNIPTYNPTNIPTQKEGGVGSDATTTSEISVTDNAQSSNDALNGSEIIYIVLIALIGGLICIIFILCLVHVVLKRRSQKNIYLENVDRQSTTTIDQHETETNGETKGENDNVNLEMQNVAKTEGKSVSPIESNVVNVQPDSENSFSEMYNDVVTKGNIVTPN
eukprot:289206_1